LVHRSERESIRTPGVGRETAPEGISLLVRGNGAVVSPERMVVGDFDHDDRNLVRVLDPHFQKSPWLSSRFAADRYPGLQQAPMLGVHISDLHPRGSIV